ncbi:hypothetical protein KIL84_006250 [Mauremys mutica]|uniref:Uncharacterized protein n=1 Tax=Mauremys mutica TaxID=74926 RepID=A0A9D3WYY6_9SAUR|nr:hypothetical protein KIL84_006250 [Mauremys mutica]
MFTTMKSKKMFPSRKNLHSADWSWVEFDMVFHSGENPSELDRAFGFPKAVNCVPMGIRQSDLPPVRTRWKYQCQFDSVFNFSSTERVGPPSLINLTGRAGFSYVSCSATTLEKNINRNKIPVQD